MVPNRASGRRRIGVVLSVLSEHYQTTIFEGLCETAFARGCEVLCIQGGLLADDGFQPRSVLFDAVRHAPIDGLIFLTAALIGNAQEAAVRRLEGLAEGVPAVSVGYPVGHLDHIAIDNRGSFETVLDHLIVTHGYRRFLYLGGPAHHADNVARETVFRQAMAQAAATGLPVEFEVAYGDFQEASGFQVVQELPARFPAAPFDAIVAANDNMAIGARKALRLSDDPRWQVCAVTGFDDVPLAAVEGPPLTTVRQPLHEMGKLAVETLCDRMDGIVAPPPPPLATTPVFRSSCGCPDGPWVTDERLSWIRTERLTGMLQSFGNRLMTAQTLQDVLGTLSTFVSLFSLSTFFLALYEGWPRVVTSLPKRVRLVYSRSGDRERVTGPLGTAFNLASLIDRGFRDRRDRPRMIVSGLSYGEEEIGLIGFDTQGENLLYLASFAALLSSALQRISVLIRRQNQTADLEREVAARTRDLITTNRLLQEEIQRRTMIQEELESRRHDLETILEAMPVPLAVTDTQWGPIRYGNRAFLSLVKGKPKDKPLGQYFSPPPVIGADGRCSTGELTVPLTSGDPRTVVAQTAPIRFRGGGEVIVGFLDISVQKALERDLLRISEYEREALGRDLHDDICQRIAGASFLMTALTRALGRDSHGLEAQARDASETVADALQRVRRYARGLFPMEIEDSGLVASLRELAVRSERPGGPRVQFRCNLDDARRPLLGTDADLHLYRIAQEALNNAVLHSGGASVKVSFRETNGRAVLAVQDDGTGLGAARPGLGLRSMNYRASQIGGKITVASGTRGGTRVRVEVPVPRDKETPWVRGS